MNLISRLRVAINHAVFPLLKLPKPFSFVGPDSSLTLCRFIAGSGARRVTLITDAALQGMGLVNPMVEALEAAGIIVDVYSDILPDPTYDQVQAGVAHLRTFSPDAVIAVGGGSPIDSAKAMLMCLANDVHPSKLIGIWLYAAPRKKCLPFYVVPTTAGTGSEVTIAAVLTDPQKKSKAPMIDPRMVPGMMALDPKLTVGLPPFITAQTGMDALTHAVEAYIALGMRTDETDELARMAITAILPNLTKACHDGNNLQAREDLLVGSSLAGLAFTRAGVGYVHAFAHQMGGLYHVPHGLANAIILPYVLEFSKPNCTHRLAELARVGGLPAAGRSDAELADDFIACIRSMNAEMQIPATIKELRREDFEGIIDRAFAEAHGTYGVPRYMARSDARALLTKLLPV